MSLQDSCLNYPKRSMSASSKMTTGKKLFLHSWRRRMSWKPMEAEGPVLTSTPGTRAGCATTSTSSGSSARPTTPIGLATLDSITTSSGKTIHMKIARVKMMILLLLTSKMPNRASLRTKSPIEKSLSSKKPQVIFCLTKIKSLFKRLRCQVQPSLGIVPLIWRTTQVVEHLWKTIKSIRVWNTGRLNNLKNPLSKG